MKLSEASAVPAPAAINAHLCESAAAPMGGCHAD